jgi:hypothetical protein
MEETMTREEVSMALAEDVRNRHADPFSMAYELTKMYAASEEPQAQAIPKLFLDLYELFTTGAVSVEEKAASEKEEKKDKKKKKDKDKEEE